MPTEGHLCLVRIKYADEIEAEFVDCVQEEDTGLRYLMIPLHERPTFSVHVLEYRPRNPHAIRPVAHPEYQFECDELVDLDAIEDASP